MEKRPSIVPFVLLGAVNYGLGYFSGYTTSNTNNNLESNKRVVAVQEINAQLTDQLSDSYEMSGLIVDDKAGSFEFTSNLPGAGRESCTGNFEIVDDIARGVGSIACTTESEI